MDKVRTPEECVAMISGNKKLKKQKRSCEFNFAVSEIVKEVRKVFTGVHCVVPLQIVYRGYREDLTNVYSYERDKEIINTAVEILQEEFQKAGWHVSVSAKTPIWPFATKIVVSDVCPQDIYSKQLRKANIFDNKF